MLKERRRHYRRQMNLPLVYTISGDHMVATKKGTSGDISDSGICLYTDVDLRKGTVVEIQIPGVLDAPRKGIVVWSLRKYFSNFKVGISFSDSCEHVNPLDERTHEHPSFQTPS